MKKAILLAAGFMLAVGMNARVSFAQSSKSQNPTIASVLDHQLSNSEREFTELAEAMPADKYDFAPANGNFIGVRTFGEQVRHVASFNYLFYTAILGEKPPAGSGGEGPDAVKTKDQILKYLKDSFALGHRALATINGENVVAVLAHPPIPGLNTRLGIAELACVHQNDHFGQMVVYLRMNGIIPPDTAQAQRRAASGK